MGWTRVYAHNIINRKKRKLDQRSPQEGGHGSILGPWVEQTVQKASQEYLESFKTALFEKNGQCCIGSIK